MRKRVKKGSSLVLVIVLMGIISILGLSLSTLAVTTYKSRIVNSTSKVNLYAAEAGIDEVYGIIGNTVDKGINYANEQVAAIDLEQAKIDKISSLFNTYPNFYELEGSQAILDDFNETTNPSGIPLVIIDVAQLYLDDGQVSASINESRLKDYQNQQFQYYYKYYVNNGKPSVDDEIAEQNLSQALTDTSKYKFTLSGESNKPEITLLNNTPFSMDVGNNIPYEVKVKSEFLDSKDGIRRAIEIEYSLEVPEYSDVYYMKNIKFPKNVVWEKAIAADGDMNVDGSKVTINGEVYVKGTDEGGVNLIGNNSSVTLQKKLATRQNINLKAQNSLFTSNENIYANNVIIYKDDSNDANGSNFNITNAEAALYLRDDLELNADNSKINIAGGFYGLYDGPDEIGDTSFLGNDHSSSVVINSDDIEEIGGSSLNIAGNVIIQGTAYINTNSEYQTGESISIKGNYKAYTRGLTIDSAISRGKSLKSDNVIFEYREPLSVVSQFLDSTPLLAPDKSKYFEAYNNEFIDSTEESDRLRTSGVNIDGNIIATAGAIIHNGNIIESQITPDEGTIKEKTRELKRNMFYMGDTTPDDNEVFNETEVRRDVTSLVNYNLLIGKTKSPVNSNIGESEEIIVLDSSNTNYAFIGRSGTQPVNSNKNYNIVDSNFKGIIVTAGDVYLTGELNFSGTIITKGNIIFLDSDEKNISYDSKLVKRLVAENYEIFSSDNPNLVTYDEMGKNNTIGTDMLKNKIIKRKNWNILK